MGRARRDMDEVELVEGGPADTPDPEGTTEGVPRRARRVLRRWWPVPAVVLVALIAWQLVDDARERAEVDRLRETAGVLGSTVAPPLTSTVWGTEAIEAVLASGSATADGTIAGLVRERLDGPWEVVGLDGATGDEIWRAVVAPATGDSAGLVPTATCAPDAEPATHLWCTVLSPELIPGPDPEVVDSWIGVTLRSSLVGVDLATGAVGAAQDLPENAVAAVVDGRQIVVTPTQDGLDVLATEVGGTTPAWHVALPDPIETDMGIGPSIDVLDGFPRIGGGSSFTVLDPADGSVLATGADTLGGRAGWLVSVQGSSTTTVLGRTDGTAGADGTVLEGSLAPTGPDDGSSPDLLLVDVRDGTPDGRLRAVDARTGQVRWEQPGRTATAGLVVLDGTVLGSTGRTLWARDLATGDLRWETETDQSQTAGWLLTDGSALLRTETDLSTGDPVLAAYGLRDGRQRWTTPLPDGLAGVTVMHGRMFGWSAEGPRVLG